MEIVFSVIFGVFMVFAYSFEKTDSAQLIMKNTSSIVLSFFMMIVLSFITFWSIKVIRFFFKKIISRVSTFKFDFKIERIFSKYPFIFSFLVLMLFWIPYAVIRYPAVSEWDAYHQIIQGLGMAQINYNWPIASTIFMSSIVKFGSDFFGDYNIGVFMLVFIQMIICSCCLAYSISIINKMKLHPIFKWIVLAIYSVATIYPRYLTAVVKDSIFACLVVLVISIQIDIFILNNTKIRNFVFLLLSCIFMCIARNNGVYLLYFCVPFLIYYCVKEKNRASIGILISFVLTIFCLKVYNALLESNGIKGGSIAEALSIPFQQTARYIIEYPEDVTDDEKVIINSVLQYDVIKEKYNPRLSDYVKATYHGEAKDLINYFGVWFKQFFRHPTVYFAATFNNSFEFFYPGARESESGLYKTTNNDENIKIFNEELMHHTLKKYLNKYIEIFEKVPIINFFCDTGCQFWLTIYIAFYAISKKNGKLFYILIPSLVGILVCIASPTYTWNGIRYALPIIYSTPILICLTAKSNEKNV